MGLRDSIERLREEAARNEISEEDARRLHEERMAEIRKTTQEKILEFIKESGLERIFTDLEVIYPRSKKGFGVIHKDSSRATDDGRFHSDVYYFETRLPERYEPERIEVHLRIVVWLNKDNEPQMEIGNRTFTSGKPYKQYKSGSAGHDWNIEELPREEDLRALVAWEVVHGADIKYIFAFSSRDD